MTPWREDPHKNTHTMTPESTRLWLVFAARSKHVRLAQWAQQPIHFLFFLCFQLGVSCPEPVSNKKTHLTCCVAPVLTHLCTHRQVKSLFITVHHSLEQGWIHINKQSHVTPMRQEKQTYVHTLTCHPIKFGVSVYLFCPRFFIYVCRRCVSYVTKSRRAFTCVRLAYVCLFWYIPCHHSLTCCFVSFFTFFNFCVCVCFCVCPIHLPLTHMHIDKTTTCRVATTTTTSHPAPCVAS